MNLSTPHITYDESSRALELILAGQTFKAKLTQDAIAQSKFTLPVTVARLLQPVVDQLKVRWDAVDAEEDIASIEADERIVHEVMALAFWWATADYNLLDDVRRIHFIKLVALSARCYEMTADLAIVRVEPKDANLMGSKS